MSDIRLQLHHLDITKTIRYVDEEWITEKVLKQKLSPAYLAVEHADWAVYIILTEGAPPQIRVHNPARTAPSNHMCGNCNCGECRCTKAPVWQHVSTWD